MTPRLADTQNSDSAVAWPRIADLLERVRHEPIMREQAPNFDGLADTPVLTARPAATAHAPEHLDAARVSALPLADARIVGIVAPEIAPPASAAPAIPAPLERAPDFAHDLTRPQPQPEIDDDAELEALIAELTLREVARDALRARMIAFGENRHHRSAYEISFILMAFALTVLVAAPPLVEILLALRGISPG